MRLCAVCACVHPVPGVQWSLFDLGFPALPPSAAPQISESDSSSPFSSQIITCGQGAFITETMTQETEAWRGLNVNGENKDVAVTGHMFSNVRLQFLPGALGCGSQAWALRAPGRPRPPRGFCGGELGLWAVPRSWVQLPLSILCDLEQVPDLSGASVFPDLL